MASDIALNAALRTAARKGDLAAVTESIAANPHIVKMVDPNGSTPLVWVITNAMTNTFPESSRPARTAIIKALLVAGADPNGVDQKNGWTTLHHAAAAGYLEAIDMLVKKGAKLTARNTYGDTPLHVAAASGKKNAVIWLGGCMGADRTATNNDGKTPEQVATGAAVQGFAELARLRKEEACRLDKVAVKKDFPEALQEKVSKYMGGKKSRKLRHRKLVRRLPTRRRVVLG